MVLFLMVELGRISSIIDIEKFLDGEIVEITSNFKEIIDRKRNLLKEKIGKNKPIYGLNTGFGKLASEKIPFEKLKQLQLNLIRSHSAGTGKKIKTDHIRLAILLLGNSLIKGYSGVRWELIELIAGFLNKNISPIVYEFGSLGASGDLAPLAHVALALIGENDIFLNNEKVSLKDIGLLPIQLEEKEGLALINGTHFSTAALTLGIIKSFNLLKNAIVISALSTDALKGTRTAFDPLISSIRPYTGQKKVSQLLFNFLNESGIVNSHKDPQIDPRVQDPYSIRCTPQVLGAVLDSLDHVKSMIEIELNSVTDNPLIFEEDGELKILSGGNFHGEPLALNGEFLTIAITEIATLSEKRTEKLLNSYYNLDLPPFLTPNPGLNSGLMIAHYTQASVLNRLTSLCNPNIQNKVSVSSHQEDHVSMSMNIGNKVLEAVELVETILAIELICSVQALHFHHKNNLYSSGSLEEIFNTVSQKIPFIDKDRILSDDINKAKQIIKNEEIVKFFEI